MVITQDNLKRQLKYNPETGTFTWLAVNSNRTSAGKLAGCVNRATGYRYIGIDGNIYKASRLAWLYMHGYWPLYQIDHVNGNRADDRFTNLRAATLHENSQNTRKRSSKTGFRGVEKLPYGKWRAQIRIRGKNRHIGVFDSPEKASQAYLAARASEFKFQPVPREINIGS